jgi:hypothetical protein
MWSTYIILFCLLAIAQVESFLTFPSARPSSLLASTAVQDDPSIQWDLFKKHHARGSWKGVWTSYDYIGDVIDETVASVDLDLSEDGELIEQSHNIVVGAKRSDCAKCFDSFDVKTLPVAKYTPDQLHKSRFASVCMVNGPSLLRSGVMATELVLAHGDGRVRVLFQHAPVWEAGVEPASCPPQGLKLFRTMVSREALRADPPTAETEEKDPPTEGNPVFFRPVPPFAWHKKWGGTSWTWGPNTGNRGWSIEDMEEADAWHGRPTGDSPNTWNLRLPGGILIQGPRVVTEGEAALCRLAWMPTEEMLLRVEASVNALEPKVMEDDTVVGFHPPSLGSLRCDVMKKLGDLEDAAKFVKEGEKDLMRPLGDEEIAKQQTAAASASETSDSKDGGESGLDAVRDALKL